ncbi:VOC family protein [Brachybacterium tyrofermentans]|uniref:VOC family protein n=1 Tax=Brachybacterium tyrofermentans TaxID=47848 RepID=A0ABW0FKR2_9MICO
MFTSVLATITVADLDAAESWYTRLFGAGPDARPMAGLLEWHLSQGNGVQVFAEEEHAGHSALVLGTDDLDLEAARLRDAGIDQPAPQPGGGARVLVLADPDGNRVVLFGA